MVRYISHHSTHHLTFLCIYLFIVPLAPTHRAEYKLYEGKDIDYFVSCSPWCPAPRGAQLFV